jgi:hypothetical protein
MSGKQASGLCYFIFMSIAFVSSDIFSMNKQVLESPTERLDGLTSALFEIRQRLENLKSDTISTIEQKTANKTINLVLLNVYSAVELASERGKNINPFDALREQLTCLGNGEIENRGKLLQVHKQMFEAITQFADGYAKPGSSPVLVEDVKEKFSLLAPYSQMNKLDIPFVGEILLYALACLNRMLFGVLILIACPYIYIIKESNISNVEALAGCKYSIKQVQTLVVQNSSAPLRNISEYRKCIEDPSRYNPTCKILSFDDAKLCHYFLYIALNVLLAKCVTEDPMLGPDAISKLMGKIKMFFERVNDCKNQEDFWTYGYSFMVEQFREEL